ncbi:hypothetical protein [Actinomadura atramentaria]|uniref:hypothetical protein n=1 Tax=Actinomadura atramentaria TaxID=1990 RepID=UPI000379F51F|nr:hypothetical protein [Actinomadura atramentaria]
MPNKTLSVREDDAPLWERADRTARAARTTVSALVATALAEYLGGTDTISVYMYEPGRGPAREERFEGRWIKEPPTGDRYGDGPEYGHTGAPAEWRYGVAETARGRIAVYVYHWNYDYDRPPELRVFENLAEAQRAFAGDPRIPADELRWLTVPAAKKMEDAPVVWRDI